jgi:aminoglycoside/choline kinase family phosphotransferase
MGGQWQALKDAAADIDRRLRECRFKTVCHGDFKSANLLFNVGNDGSVRCGAYDFQYVGSGSGMKDVVYLFASSVQASVLQRNEAELLQYYYDRLVEQLGGDVGGYSSAVMDAQYKLAMLDYVRFMAGWGFWGSVRWAQTKAEAYMKELPGLLTVPI